MKKTLIFLLSLILAIPAVRAVPASPTPYRYTQPDGSVIVLQNHGDEFFHWTTDILGRIVEKGADGFYRPSGTARQTFAARAAQAAQQRTMNRIWSSFENPPVTNFGHRKVLCIIANFTDSTFVADDPNQHFTNMLNQEGYSENGSIGSVRDYYIANSLGEYIPEFDVYGPVTLSHSSQYYDENGAHVAIIEAYGMLESQININDYDTDNDGSIDMVLFYYPGHNEAEGGGQESIWPHQSTGYFGSLGGKSFTRYFCTSELFGSTGTVPASIGTTCHEFAHSLGLPDFYDTDYNNSGGQNNTTGVYDLMSSGNYNDNGRRPPFLNAMERNMLGWMDYPAELTASGNHVLPAIQNNVAFRFDSSMQGEYFILETRNGQGWDSAVPAGMLLYQVDKSDRLVGGGYTAAQLWQGTNMINAYGGHPCFRLISAIENPGNWSNFVFPGSNNVTSVIPTGWDGNPAAVSISSITYDGNKVTFTAAVSTARTVTGKVTDTEGKPLSGVQVCLTPSVAPFNAAPTVLSNSLSVVTDGTGSFLFELDESADENQILSASKDGYVPFYVNLTISSFATVHDFVLLRQGEGVPQSLSRYDASLSLSNWSFGSSSIALGMHYYADEIEAMNGVGALLKDITFLTAAQGNDGETIYVVVDIGGEIVLRKDVTAQSRPNQWVTVDISDENIIIPAGKDIVIGYGINAITTKYPIYAFTFSATGSDAAYTNWDFMNSTSWGPVSYSNSGYFNFPVSATLSRTAEVDFSTLGYSYIRIDNGIPAVVVAAGKSLRSTAWFLDGAAVNTPPAVASLPAGAHTYMVRLNYYDGTSERVYYDVTAH